jgi:dienelactone hydrolase
MCRTIRSVLLVAVFALALSVMSSGARSENEHTAEVIRFQAESMTGESLELVGHLRRPRGRPGPFPAVILLHGCAGDWRGMDSRWGTRLVEWGYVALSVDSYGPRGIKNVCENFGADPADHPLDAYGALGFLATQAFVIPDRVAVMGVSGGAKMALSDVERGSLAEGFSRKFRAAVALYPACQAINGAMAVPTLILIGELDDWVSPKACQDLAAGYPNIRSTLNGPQDTNIRLVVLPGAYHAFDNTSFPTGQRYLGHWLEYNENATNRCIEEIKAFLGSYLGD